MSWKLREVSFPFTDGKGVHQREPGDCWRIPLDHEYEARDGETYGEVWAHRLSPEFKASGRDHVLHIVLPGGGTWSPDFKASSSESGWTVTGTFPALTASPSVNAEGSYHGWLRDGALTDDVEGRTYP